MSTSYKSIATALAVAALSLLSIPAITTTASASGSVVAFKGDASAGTIVVRTSERRLYLVLGQGRALSYPVGVGKAGRQWAGRAMINGKHIRPAWQAPADIAGPGPNRVIPGGAPNNPMGVAAMTLSGGDYAIHGTNNPGSIGGFVSHGCIRMYNQDITDLYDRVNVGTPVIVSR
jgi:lipoprotein-anchoring transpeptidase ErfK/SrfK